ncbi:unnamed protein product [Urochloa humidicola]
MDPLPGTVKAPSLLVLKCAPDRPSSRALSLRLVETLRRGAAAEKTDTTTKDGAVHLPHAPACCPSAQRVPASAGAAARDGVMDDAPHVLEEFPVRLCPVAMTATASGWCKLLYTK